MHLFVTRGIHSVDTRSQENKKIYTTCDLYDLLPSYTAICVLYFIRSRRILRSFFIFGILELFTFFNVNMLITHVPNFGFNFYDFTRATVINNSLKTYKYLSVLKNLCQKVTLRLKMCTLVTCFFIFVHKCIFIRATPM